MWKEQALAGWEGEVRQLLPPPVTSYWHMTGRAGLTQQLMTREGGPQESRAPQVPTSQVFIVSRDCLEFKPSTYLHREPPNSPGKVEQGVVIKAKNQTQTRPDQFMGAASGPGLTSLGCIFLRLAKKNLSVDHFSLNSTPQDCQDPTSKLGCHKLYGTPFSCLGQPLPIPGLMERKVIHSFIGAGTRKLS